MIARGCVSSAPARRQKTVGGGAPVQHSRRRRRSSHRRRAGAARMTGLSTYFTNCMKRSGRDPNSVTTKGAI
jgi:hypothetical protein